MAFFEIAPMGGMSVGGYPIGGARKGETLSEEQKERMRMGRISSQEALIRMAQQYPNASPEEIAYNHSLIRAQSRSKKMTPEQKRANALARLQDPSYMPAERKTYTFENIPPKRLLKNKLFGSPKQLGFRRKMSPEDVAHLLTLVEQQGFGFWDTLGNIGKTALEVAPHILPFL
jgi:hypothetical protein